MGGTEKGVVGKHNGRKSRENPLANYWASNTKLTLSVDLGKGGERNEGVAKWCVTFDEGGEQTPTAGKREKKQAGAIQTSHFYHHIVRQKGHAAKNGIDHQCHVKKIRGGDRSRIGKEKKGERKKRA